MRIATLTKHLVLAASIAIASCGSSANWPACSWPPAGVDTDPSTRSSDRCLAARTLLSCSAPGGAGEICLSNNPSRCADDALGADDCHAACAENEYAVSCGGVGPGPVPAPPAGCHTALPIPSGSVLYCCPCGA